MKVLDSARVGPLRIRLVRGSSGQLYLVSDHATNRFWFAMDSAGTEVEEATDRLYRCIDNLIARRAAEAEGAA